MIDIMMKDTPNDTNHTYGIITKVLTKSSKKTSQKAEGKKQQIFYTVQCYDQHNINKKDKSSAAKPRLRKCHIPKPTLTNPKDASLQSVALAVDDIVLIEPQNPKTGCIVRVYSRNEKAELLKHDLVVPVLLLQRLKEEGCQETADVSFDDTARTVMSEPEGDKTPVES